MKEDTLNHNKQDPLVSGLFLFKMYWALWAECAKEQPVPGLLLGFFAHVLANLS